MTLKRLNPGPRMSQAVCIGDIAFLAGQVPDDLGADIQVWLADMADFQGMNAVWDEWVDRDAPPARATGGVPLARAGMRVEMIAVVALPKSV
jgi:enamine deaminase RidA (YjgF/YER057c/UK114 family)